MDTMPECEKISIIVPVYKCEKYLDRCVKSILNQTYKNIEILLVDDGSPDRCPQLCDEWAKKDNRIKVIHKKNGGAFSARLTGITNSCGKYIGFVDSDDWIEPDMYEYLYGLIINYDAEIANSKIRHIDENGSFENNENASEIIKIFNFIDIFKNMNQESLWSLCNNLYKRSLFDSLPDLPTNLVFSEDMLMNYFLYKQINKLVVSNLVKYSYFRHADSAIAGGLTYNIVDDSILAYKIIDDDFDKKSPAYPYSISLKILNDMFLINSIIRNNKCFDRYDKLRKDILIHKKYVFSKKCKNIFSLRHKIGIILLMIAPKFYNKTILLRSSLRGY